MTFAGSQTTWVHTFMHASPQTKEIDSARNLGTILNGALYELHDFLQRRLKGNNLNFILENNSAK